jgi:hypothetical protein
MRRGSHEVVDDLRVRKPMRIPAVRVMSLPPVGYKIKQRGVGE